MDVRTGCAAFSVAGIENGEASDRPEAEANRRRHEQTADGYSEGHWREGAEIAMLSRNQHWNWTKEDDERLMAFVAQGASVVRAAAALKRKIVSVRVRARALGCPFPPPPGARRKRAGTPNNV